MNMLAVSGMDTSNEAALALLKRIAEKAVEPMTDDADPTKTLGECRHELLDLIFEAIQFVATRNVSAALRDRVVAPAAENK